MRVADRLLRCVVLLGVSLSTTSADAQLTIGDHNDMRATSPSAAELSTPTETSPFQGTTVGFSPAALQDRRDVRSLPLRRRTFVTFVEIVAKFGRFDDIRTTRSVGTVTTRLNGQEIDQRSIDASATADDDAVVGFKSATVAPRLGTSFDVRGDGTSARIRLYGYYGRYWQELTSQPTDRTQPSLTFQGAGTSFGGSVGIEQAVSERVRLWGSYGISRGSANLSSNRTSLFPSFNLRQDENEIVALEQQLTFGVGRDLGSQVALRAGIAGHWTDIKLQGQFAIVDDDAGAGAGIPNQVAEILTTFAEDFDANTIAADLGADVCHPSGRVCGSADFLSSLSGPRRIRFGFGARLRF